MAPSKRDGITLADVLLAFGISNASIHDIRSGRVNKHWRAVGDESYVLRRYSASRSHAAIRFEHDLLRHMKNRGWPVAVPLSIGSECTLEYEGLRYALFPLLPGRPTATRTVPHSRFKGRLLARLHNDMASWEPYAQRDGFGRMWELDIFVRAASQYSTFNELLMTFGKSYKEHARAIRSQKYAVLRELSSLAYGELPTRPCHFDFHRENLLFHDGELSGLLDFDLARLDARVADIASSIALDCLAPPAYNEIDPNHANAFVTGYTELAPLNHTEAQLIVPLVRAYIVWLVAYRLAQWSTGKKAAQRSIERSVTERFPRLERQRPALEAAVLQAAAGGPG
jgi:Ser/Thr protein kinase RdoA (MazF antagonist)